MIAKQTVISKAGLVFLFMKLMIPLDTSKAAKSSNVNMMKCLLLKNCHIL